MLESPRRFLRHTRIAFALILALGLGVGTNPGVFAAGDSVPPAAAKICFGCHGNTGIGRTSAVPHLAGQHEDYLRQTMKLYHLGERENSMMSAMSYPMREEDINDLAAYYASQVSE